MFLLEFKRFLLISRNKLSEQFELILRLFLFLNCIFSLINNATPPPFLLVLELFTGLLSIVYKLAIFELYHVSVNPTMEKFL